MNAIRQTQQLNKRELENATPPSASWHADYRDTAWVYVGGLPLDLSEGDVVTIFSQFGNPTHLNLIRDRETGKSKGFGFLKYEDQRSCDLAVDNLTGADVLGRLLRVDHTRYKKKDDEDEDTHRIDRLEAEAHAEQNGTRASDTEESDKERNRRKKRRLMLKDEKELEDTLAIKQHGEDEDPTKDYLIRGKRDQIDTARRRDEDRERRHRHHQRRHKDDDDRGDRHKRHRHRPRDGGDKGERSSGKDCAEEQGEDRSEESRHTRRGQTEEWRSRRPDNLSADLGNREKARRRRSRSSSHDHRSTRKRYSSDEDYGRRESARERRRRHADD